MKSGAARLALLFTCEHGGNQIPREFQSCFLGHHAITRSHRGWDPGTLELGKRLSAQFHAPLIAHQVSRLVVEVNRSESHPRLFSEMTRTLSAEQKRLALQRYYHPHREKVVAWIERHTVDRQIVVHIGVHSFTPELAGQIRQAEIGLLYDPRRVLEKSFCRIWTAHLRRADDWRVRRNYPYLGKSDGLVTHLRTRFSPRAYLGIELEVNQSQLVGPVADPRRVARVLANSLQATLDEFHPSRDVR